jgi:transposase, IS30 family
MRERPKRRFFTAAESAEIWDRWRQGQGLWTIARAFGKRSSSIFAHISPTGGIQPPRRRRSRLSLTLAEREEISRTARSAARGMPRPRPTRAAGSPTRSRSASDRAVPGHWEGDLLCGSKNSYIVTLVERHSRYVMLAKIPSRDTHTVVNALIKQAKKLPDHLYQSLTWDRGVELTDHKRFTLATDIQVYFCDPQSPWQRGSNENTNRLLRQYFPRGTDLSVHSQTRLNYVARELNERPRETLGFKTPKEKYQASVASTG